MSHQKTSKRAPEGISVRAGHKRPGRWVTVACGLVLITGCTPAPATGSPPAGASSSVSSASVSSAPLPGAADAVTIDITVHNGQVTPNGQKINLTQGQTVVLRVTSDAEDEVHAHTAGDGYELEVHPGRPTRGQFVAADTGTFEVELHHLDKIVAILVVR